MSPDRWIGLLVFGALAALELWWFLGGRSRPGAR